MIDHTIAEPVSSAQPGSPLWLAMRRAGLGGSDAAAALGLSAWRTQMELYYDKRGELPPRLESPSQRWGTIHEPAIIAEYARLTGYRVARPGAMFRSVRYPFMQANFDGFANEERVVEAKTSRTSEGWGEPGTDEIPFDYLLQTQHYLIVAAKPVADVAVLIAGSDFRIYEVPADRELQEMLVEGEAEFWRRVKRAEPPDPTSIEDARLRWGRLPIKGTLLAEREDLERAARLHETSEAIKFLVEQAEADRAAVMARLGDRADVLVDQAGRPLISWKLARAPMRFDVETFTAEHPELAAGYMRPGTPSRRFLIKDAAADAAAPDPIPAAPAAIPSEEVAS